MAKRIERYLKETKTLKLFIDSTGKSMDPIQIESWSDADFATDKSDNKSVSECVLTMDGAVVPWACKKQTDVSLNTMEAEFIANATGVSECLWVKDLLSELRPTPNCEPLSLNIDNEAAIMNMENSVSSPRSKHINIRFHFAGDNVQVKRVTYTTADIRNARRHTDQTIRPHQA